MGRAEATVAVGGQTEDNCHDRPAMTATLLVIVRPTASGRPA